MSDYDALYYVVLRLQDDEDVTEQAIFHSEVLAEQLKTIYSDFVIVPVATMEIEDETDTLTILEDLPYIDTEEIFGKEEEK